MKLLPGKVLATTEWSNKDFNARYAKIPGNNIPEDIKIYLADKELILQKKLFAGMPFLHYKADAKLPPNIFRLMPVIAVDRRYAYYYVQVDAPGAIEYIELTSQAEDSLPRTPGSSV